MDTLTTDPSAIGAILRLGLAALLGGLIGLDREASGKPAGFRTNILICVGAALLTELSIDVARRWVQITGMMADPGRIAAQIVSGIGFLGAGAIIQSRLGVRGLTTAATIWVVAAIGMAVGGGAPILAIAATAGVVITLALLSRLEVWLGPRTVTERWIRLRFHSPGPGARERTEAVLRQHGVRIRSREIERRDKALDITFRGEARSEVWDGVLEALLRDESVTRATLE